MTCIALLRGINVGGSHLLPMKELKVLFEQNGCRDVQTYIQSGNVVFRSPKADARAWPSGSRPPCQRVTASNRASWCCRCRAGGCSRTQSVPPSARATEESAPLLSRRAAEETGPAGVRGDQARTERFALDGNVFYLYTPDGFGISKLAARAERLLGVAATARNWRTVQTLLEMAKGAELAIRTKQT